jgi:intracellular sulfur oxidation DsrE/DsrF family protein
MWAKYGATLADAQAKETPKANPSAASLAALSNQGVQFAVCAMATSRIAGMIARAAGSNAEAVNKELMANLVSNGRMVPAGIIAVNRAQERGYSFVRG